MASPCQQHPQPTEREVREGLEGNLCRCTGYHNIVKAVLSASGQSVVALDAPRPGATTKAGEVPA